MNELRNSGARSIKTEVSALEERVFGTPRFPTPVRLVVTRHLGNGWFSFPRFREPSEFEDFSGRVRDFRGQYRQFRADWSNYFESWVEHGGNREQIAMIEKLFAMESGDEGEELYFRLLHVFSTTPATYGDMELWAVHKDNPDPEGAYRLEWVRERREEPWKVEIFGMDDNSRYKNTEFKEDVFLGALDTRISVWFHSLYSFFNRPDFSMRTPQDPTLPKLGRLSLNALALEWPGASPGHPLFLGWLYLKPGKQPETIEEIRQNLTKLQSGAGNLKRALFKLTTGA